MGDYPLGVDGKGKPGGRIKVLEDTTGTGKYDKATVFLDGLAFPTGVLPWGKGVLVTCAPEIFYAEDTDGDGKADVRRTLYTGFNEGNQQHRVNGLVWGLDNWIYGANGDSDGVVKSLQTGQTVNISGRDFRIRPDEGSIEAVTGRTQYGRCKDDWGNWFGCNNSDPMYHFVLDDHYLRRNPHIAPPNPRVQVSVQPGASAVYPVSRTLPRFNDPGAANHFTSACSVMVYRDDLFGPQFAGNSFVSEPVHNLIHREIMAPKGVTFTSHRAIDEQRSEFLASTDNWTRPTMIQTGPDGAIWIADMYRQVIEHPEWIPKDWQKRLDLRAGHDKGRIYRVYPVGKRPRPIPRLDKMTTAELVAALDSPSGWQRDMAQQLLIRGKDPAAKPLLEKMVLENKQPLARLHALCTVDGLRLPTAVRRKALLDPSPGVRRHAVRMLGPDLPHIPELMSYVDPLVRDPDPQVRLELAYALGETTLDKEFEPQHVVLQPPRERFPNERDWWHLWGKPLGQLALRDPADPYLTAAVLSSTNKYNLENLLLTVLAGDGKGQPPAALIANLLRMADALGDTKVLSTLLAKVAAPEKKGYATWQFVALASLLDALDARNSSVEKLRDKDTATKATFAQVALLFDAARKTFADAKAAPEERLQAVLLLGRGFDHQQEDIKLLADLLVPQSSAEMQFAAVTTLGKLRERNVPSLLLRGWKGFAPTLRAQVLDVLLRRPESVKATLDAVEAKTILAFEIDAARRQRLLQHADASVRQRAAQLFKEAVNPDRQKVVDAYRSALTLRGDAKRGQQVFAKTCASCHRFQDQGHAVGPDLASVGDKSPEGLLVAVLDPNRAVEARYINYVAQTKNGLTFTGILTSETGTSITLLGPDGKQQVILRTDLEELVSSNKSLMPEGLEKDLKPQDVADLIAHVRASVPAK
jgi:putative membrane-bound dehydrogenase-like protein